MNQRRGNHDRSGSGEPDPEESGGSVEPSPELEEALREAAAAVPDPAERRRRSPDEPVVVGEPVEPGEVGDDEVRKELEQQKDRLLRLQADFDNFRKRAFREKEEALQFGIQNLVKDLLPVVDNLGRAIDHARQKSGGGDLQGLLQGVELVWRELEAALEKHQVREIEAKGQLFNPALHEAMAQIPDPNVAPNTIVEVLQKGYRLRDRLIRPARVVVARKPEEPGREGEPSAS